VPCYNNASKTPGSLSPSFPKNCTRLSKNIVPDRELLAMYGAVKHFRHMLEVRHFTIFTDHKPITYTSQQQRDNCPPKQFNHLDFIAQFTTDIRHISGENNVVADDLSRFESVSAPPSYDAVAALQDSDDELETLRQSITALRLEKLPIPGTMVSIHILRYFCRETSAIYSSSSTAPSVSVRP
jgi:cleavage and polyadenylation specificity factor subunit 1